MIKERVEKGAALLDKEIPEWLGRQRPGLLNMMSGCSCVLGWSENERDYWITIRKLFPLAQDEQEIATLAFEHGFNINYRSDRYGFTEEDERYYCSLTATWKKFIEERRKQNA